MKISPISKVGLSLIRLLLLLAIPISIHAQTTVDFNYTGAVQTWEVPLGVTAVTIETWGAQGNNNAGGVAGGLGGYATGELAVTSGETLYIYVGGGGIISTAGGWNGGGTAGTVGCTTAFGGGGGGASDVRQGGTGLADRVIVGAGGGGAGGNRVQGCGRGTGGGGGGGWYGGGGGAAWPGTPYDYNSTLLATGGTQNAGGNGGLSSWVDNAILTVPNNDGYPGSFGLGGTGGDEILSNQSDSNTGPTGANGGGSTGATANYDPSKDWTGMSGAGGSSYIGGVSSGSTSAGVRSGNGFVRITIACDNPLDPPTIDCSNLTPSVTVNTRTGFCNYVVQGTEFDPADFSCNVTNILVDYTAADNLNGAIFPVGITPVTWTVSNSENETASCTFNVIVEDNQAPSVGCQDLTVQLNAAGSGAISASDMIGVLSENCGIASFSANPNTFDCNDVGSNTSSLTVMDTNGNSSSCLGTITVEDNVAPTAICQNVTVQLDANGNGSITANEVDNGSNDACGIGNLSVSPNTFDCDNVGANNVTLTVTDNNSNTSTCTATVTVEDNVAPNAVCQNITVQLDATGYASIHSGSIDGGSTDACVIGTRNTNPFFFSCNDIGVRTSTLTVWDTHGNSSTCSATVTVEDNVAPTALCQNITVQLDGTGNVSISGSDLDGGSTDICGIFGYSASPSNFGCTDIGSNTSILTVTDDHGNSSTCTATVTVEDNVAPTALCQDFTLNLDNDSTTILSPASIDGGSSTPCGTFSLRVSPNSFDCDDLGGGPFTVTLTVTDDSNNQTDDCTANVTVADPDSYCCDAPVAVCQNITVQLNANGEASITANDVDGGSEADCGLQSLVATPTTFACSDVGTNTVSLTITDVNADSDNCTATVTVEDNVAPNAICQNITVQLDDNGEASIEAADIDGGSNDACGIASLSADITTFDCAQEGPLNPVTVTLTVTDNNGKTSTCFAQVEVDDQIAPVAGCQNITVQLDDNGEASILPADVEQGSTDNCGFANPLSVSLNTFSCDDLGANSVTLTVGDGNGNHNSCMATVTVEDNVVPSAICQNITVQLDDNGEASIEAADVDGGSTDACGSTSISATPTDFDCEDVGGNTVTLTVTDNNGNDNTCTATVTVEDNIAPEITLCQGNSIDFNGEDEILSSTGIDFEAEDACGIATVTYDPEYISCEQLGETVPVTVTVTDVNGNSNDCIANVWITGLPCGWMDFGDDGIGCVDSNNASYEVPTETFTLESEGCYSTNWTADNAAYLKYELCGDGEIIAHVASLNPISGGWAGISARESEVPGSKKVALATNLGNLLRREIRTTPNGYAVAQQLFSPGKTWLKLVRSGNLFVGYASTNGVNWQNVLVANVAMSECIQFGLYVTNTNAGTATATFDHVEVTESYIPSLSSPNTEQQGANGQSFATQDFGIFPNPATAEIQVDLSSYYGEEVEVQIFDQLGQPVLKRRLKEVGSNPVLFDLNKMNSGTYFIRLIADHGEQTKKFLIVK